MDPRAVQLGSLFVRGLTYLIAANSACGFPYPMGELMPWKTFDGLLFHSKYLQAHSGCPKEELLEGNSSWMSSFMSVRELVLEACRRRGVPIHSRPRRLQHRDGAARPVETDDQHRVRGHQLHHSIQHQPRASAHFQHGYRPRHPKRGRYLLAPRWPQSQN